MLSLQVRMSRKCCRTDFFGMSWNKDQFKLYSTIYKLWVVNHIGKILSIRLRWLNSLVTEYITSVKCATILEYGGVISKGVCEVTFMVSSCWQLNSTGGKTRLGDSIEKCVPTHTVVFVPFEFIVYFADGFIQKT